jgi:hypothetical protein
MRISIWEEKCRNVSLAAGYLRGIVSRKMQSQVSTRFLASLITFDFYHCIPQFKDLAWPPLLARCSSNSSTHSYQCPWFDFNLCSISWPFLNE